MLGKAWGFDSREGTEEAQCHEGECNTGAKHFAQVQ